MSAIIIRKIHGHSMMPVLPPGTYIWATNIFKKIKIDDIVVFEHEGKEKIKRVKEIKDDQLYVLGDHSEASVDSRQFGWINTNSVLGRVFWPRAPRTRAENVDASEKR